VVYESEVLVQWLVSSFDLLDLIEVLTESINLIYKVFGREVEDKLNGEVLEHVQFGLLAVLMHTHVELIFGCQKIMALEVVHQFFLSMNSELVEANSSGDW